MSRWKQPTEAWEPMLKGNPASSSYLWIAILLSFSALLGIAKVIIQVHSDHNQVMLWLPSMVGMLVLMALAAGGAIRAINAARSLATETTEASGAAAKKAFEKFRIYFFCAALVSLATWGLVTFLS